jgi:tricorn protease
MYRFFYFLILFEIVFFTSSAQNQLLCRQPALNQDGSLVAFSFQGDIWTVPSAGGKASRLTIHEAYETKPVFSLDGSKIAFSGARYGNNDIFVMPAEGGVPKRLTFHSGFDNIASWTQPDKILFSANREFGQIERPNEVYAVNPKGGTEYRILDAVGFDPVLSPDGRFLAFVRGDINPVARQAYKGSSNRELWLFDTKNKTFIPVPGFETNDVSPQWGNTSTLYFLSSIDGSYNIYRLGIDAAGKVNKKPEKLTNYKDESIRAFSVAGNGGSIVFEKDTHIYTLKTTGGSAEKLNIQIHADNRLDPQETKTLTTGASQYAVSANGKLMSYTIRGEVFLKEADKENSRSVNISEHSFRDTEPAWLSDTTLLFTSDRANGNFDIYLARSVDTAQHNIFKSLKRELVQLTKTTDDESGLTVSNDGKKIAYVRGRGTLVVAEITAKGGLSNEKILVDGWASPSGIMWSPDDKWLSYSLEDLYFNEEVFIQAADNASKPVNVSMHPRGDRRPFWSADGSKLGFVSERSAGKSDDVYFLWLKKEDWEKETQDWQEKATASPEIVSAKPGDKGDKKEKAPKPIRIDFDKIYERIVQVTNFPTNESDLVISKDGETFYYTTNSSNATGRDLYSIKWNGKELKEVTKNGANVSNVSIDKEGKYLYFGKQGGLGRIDVKTNLTENLPFASKLKINYVAERTQVFEEAWRVIRDNFYDPKFHGYDWEKLHDKYKERCINASVGNDFRDMFNLMLGELNSSHMGLSVIDRADTQKDATGLIGAEIVPVNNGVKITHIVPNGPADKEKSKLSEGEIIIAVNGEKIGETSNFHEMLNGMVNEKVLLTVQALDGKTREVAIRLTGNINDNLYEEWVQNRKKLVEKFSNGRLGYIHIKGMDFPSFEVVEREFTVAGYGKEGLLIDVRYNGGGSTTDYLMTILNYKQHAYTIPRGASKDLEKDKLKFKEYYPTGERLVYAAWTKPSIALCNEGSYSNAEIFSHAYKSLGIGKLVGIPTNGSVISTGGKSLMDGSFVRMPFRAWFTKTSDKNQELGAAIPDFIVENQPDWLAKGTDDQLKKAVEELLKEINAKK